MIISHYNKVSKYRQLRYICLSTGGVWERGREKESLREWATVTEGQETCTNNAKNRVQGNSNVDWTWRVLWTVWRSSLHDHGVSFIGIGKGKISTINNLVLQLQLNFVVENKVIQNQENYTFIHWRDTPCIQINACNVEKFKSSSKDSQSKIEKSFESSVILSVNWLQCVKVI